MEPLLPMTTHDGPNVRELIYNIYQEAGRYTHRTDGIFKTDLYYDMFFCKTNGSIYWWIPVNHPISELLYEHSNHRIVQHINKRSGQVIVWDDDAVFDIINYIIDMCKEYDLKINADPADTTPKEREVVEFNGSVLEHVEVTDLDDVVVSFKTTSSSASSIKNK